MGYRYVNGCYEVETPIYDGFKRFHSMNAQTSHFEIPHENGMGNRFTVWQLISYNTRICQITYDHKHNTISVYLNGNPYGYSRSTSRQFNRWIDELPIHIGCIRNIIDDMRPVTPEVLHWHDNKLNVTMYGYAVDFNRIWR